MIGGATGHLKQLHHLPNVIYLLRVKACRALKFLPSWRISTLMRNLAKSPVKSKILVSIISARHYQAN